MTKKKSRRVIQPVSFNIDDVYERGLREFAYSQQRYFSKYVKRLIENDRLRQELEGIDKVVVKERKVGKVIEEVKNKVREEVSSFL